MAIFGPSRGRTTVLRALRGALDYFEAELEEIEVSVAPLSQDLSVKIEDEVIPPMG